MVVASTAGIEQDVDAGVRQLDTSFRKVPGYAVEVAKNVSLWRTALAYSDPEMTRAGREIGLEIGGGIRHFAVALGKDMVNSAWMAGATNNRQNGHRIPGCSDGDRLRRSALKPRSRCRKKERSEASQGSRPFSILTPRIIEMRPPVAGTIGPFA